MSNVLTKITQSACFKKKDRIPYINAVVLMGLFTFLFLGAEYLYVDVLSRMVSEDKTVLAQNYALGVSAAGFLLYSLLNRFCKNRLKAVCFVMISLTSVLCIALICMGTAYTAIFIAGLVLFLLLGLFGSAVFYVSMRMMKTDRYLANAKDSEKDYLVCDENGFAQTKDMPYGVYTVHQTGGWEGTEFMSDFDVNISENGQTYRYLINNAEFESYVKVVKVDSETGKTISYEGAGFEIYDSNDQKISMMFAYPTPTTIDTFYTNSEGYLITPEVLPYGEYSLVEVQAPVGYVLNSTPVSFTISAENAEEENALTVIKVSKENTAQKGRISVRKTGDIFTSVTMASSAYTDENGEMTVNPTTYTPVFASGNLSGTVFQVIASENIVTLDGTVRASAGDVVAEITTNENGYANTDRLLSFVGLEVYEKP